MNVIEINNNPFSKDGCIGRFSYLISGLASYALMILLPLLAFVKVIGPVVYDSKSLGDNPIINIIFIGIILLVSIFPGFYFGYRADAKRHADIDGKEVSGYYNFCFIIFMRIVPVINVFYFFYLLFMPGKITSPEGHKAVNKFANDSAKGLISIGKAGAEQVQKQVESVKSSVKSKIQDVVREELSKNENIEEKLIELRNLHEKNLISDQEYQEARTNLLKKVS